MARPGLSNHVKFRRLLRMVDAPEALLRGNLECMWEVAYESGDPVLGDPDCVEAAAKWPGQPGQLFTALLNCGGEGGLGFIEPVQNQPGRFQVHDLFDHAPDYVRRRMQREAARKARGKTLSELRAEAGRKGAETTNGLAGNRSATDGHLPTDSGKRSANGATPAPAPKNKKNPSDSSRQLFEPIDLEIAQWMFGQIVKLQPARKQPNFQKWGRDIHLLRVADGRTPDAIRDLFDRANKDPFWQLNILSPSKLREKWDDLDLKLRVKLKGNGKPRTRELRGVKHESDTDEL